MLSSNAALTYQVSQDLERTVTTTKAHEPSTTQLPFSPPYRASPLRSLLSPSLALSAT